MSKASKYAEKMKDLLEKQRMLTKPTPPRSFSISWPGGGRTVAKVGASGNLNIDEYSLSPEEALQLRDWIDETYSDGAVKESAIFKKALVKIKNACDPRRHYPYTEERWNDINNAMDSVAPYLTGEQKDD